MEQGASEREQQQIEAMRVDLTALEGAGAVAMLELAPTAAFQIVALLQLALRHPEVPLALQVTGQHVVDMLQVWFDGEGANAVVEVIELGKGPQDEEEPTDQPRIILP